MKEAGFEEASLAAPAIEREQIEIFQPVWKPRYLAYPRGANLSKITRALSVMRVM